MAAFQFPDPLVQQTVVNPVTGSTYQWQDPPGKWVVTVKAREVSDIIWEGDDSPSAPGYKLWYSTDTLELYFYYTDSNGTGAWLPTSKPITLIDDLDTSLTEVKADVRAANVVINEHENRLDSIIYFGPTPPLILPDNVYTDLDGNVTTEQNEVNYKFWLNTTDNQLSILRIDADASSGYSYAEVSSNPDLQEVCENGNVSNIPIAIETENGVSVLEDQALRITHQNNPYIRLVDEVDMDSVELSLQSDHAHIDLSDANDVLHFKFAGEEKVTFKGQGDAEFLGKVKVEPGTTGNEVVTYQQLNELEEEIEDLRPSIERGNWEFIPNSPPSVGKFTLMKVFTTADCNAEYVECIANAGGDSAATTACNRRYDECDTAAEEETPEYTSGWIATLVLLNIIDSNTETHTFEDAEAGEYLELANEDGSGFALYEIAEVRTNQTGRTYFKVVHARSSGAPGGKTKVKVFKLASSDPTDYVRKTGDTMTGALKTTNIELSKSNFITAKNDGSTLWSYGTAGDGNMGTFVVGSGKEFKMGTGSAQTFKIYADSKCRVSNLKDPGSDLDATHRKYVQDEIAKATNAHWGWTFEPNIAGANLQAGQFTGDENPSWNSGKKHTYFFHKEALNGKQMDFYKNYHQYFKMGHLSGSFWYLDTGKNTWKMKGMFFIRDLYFGYSDSNPQLFALKTHSDFDDTENSKWPSTLAKGTVYYLKIGGIL